MTQQDEAAPKQWRDRFFEDFEVGDVYRSRLGRTISEVDNTWITALTMNTNQVHFNAAFAERTRFGQLLVNSCLTLSLVTGRSPIPARTPPLTCRGPTSSCRDRYSSATPSGRNQRSSRPESRARTLASESSRSAPGVSTSAARPSSNFAGHSWPTVAAPPRSRTPFLYRPMLGRSDNGF